MSEQTINVAHIRNGIVENICVHNALPTEDYINGYEYIDITGAPVTIGWEYAEGVITNPNNLKQVFVVGQGMLPYEEDQDTIVTQEGPPADNPNDGDPVGEEN